MSDESFPLKAIIGRRYYQPKYAANNASSVELTLECGHKITRPKSGEPRKSVRCEDCYYDQTQSQR